MKNAGLVIGLTIVLVGGACSSTGSDGAGTTSPTGEQTTTSTTRGPDESAETTGTPVPSPGCDNTEAAALSLERQDLDVDGTERWYLLTAPARTPDMTPVPLVFDFHGLAEGAEFHAAATGWNELAQAEGFVVAFPQGTGTPASWNIASSGENPDLDFVDAMLEQLGAQQCIDESRVYSTGLSNGALLSSVLACSRADDFAAVAPVAGVSHPPDCAADRPVPVLAFHGTADPLLPFNGGVDAAALAGALGGDDSSTTTAPPADLDGEGYPKAAALWAETNGCGNPTEEQLTESVVRRTWDCPDGGEVAFLMIEGGGHTWPGSDALANEAIAELVGPTTFEIDATELTWEFFGRHSRP